MEKSHFSSTFAVAFGNRIALTNDPVVVRATDASALPTHSRSSWGPRKAHVFATSSWQNELLVIFDQQKVCLMIIFAA